MRAGLIARPLLLIAIPFALSSCGLAPTRPVPAAPAVSSAPTSAPTSDAAITHLLSRITFGPRPGDLERVRSIGGPAYLEQQLHPARIDYAPAAEVVGALPTLSLSIAELLQQYPRPDPALRDRARAGEMSQQEPATMTPPERRPARIVSELAAAKLARAVMSDRQLQEVMVDFWFNHFNVSADKGVVRWYVTAYERDAIRPHALATFRDLVRATAAHPAMLWYLDNWASTRADFVIPQGPNQGRTAGLNENYARELMELHTLGVDGGYTQGDVREVARAFTGWTIDRPREQGRFTFRPAMHDIGPKTVLGHRLPAGGGQADGERVIDILTRHPSTARFIATKLTRRFVADDPPPALVARVAAVYQRTDGDIRAMLRTILTAPEFYAASARRAKIKKPFEFVASSVRALGGTVDTRGAEALARAVGTIGERLYQAEPPTGYPDRAEPWINPGALLARLNFALHLSGNRLDGVRVDPVALVRGADRTRPDDVLDHLLGTVLLGQATAGTRAVLAAQLEDARVVRKTADDRGPADTDVGLLTALVLGSPEFQRR